MMIDHYEASKVEEELENIAIWHAAHAAYKSEPNIQALKEAVRDLLIMMEQKTAGQRAAKRRDNVRDWGLLPRVKMDIITESVILVCSGAIDKIHIDEVDGGVRGRWLYEEKFGDLDERFVCSACGYESGKDKLTKYCPGCGAKMEDEND